MANLQHDPSIIDDVTKPRQLPERAKPAQGLSNFLQRIRASMFPENDIFLKTLKHNNTTSVNYLFDKDRVGLRGGPAPWVACALAGGLAMFAQGGYTVGHEVAAYGAEYAKIAFYNITNLFFSVLNSSEAVFDIVEVFARSYHYKQVKEDYANVEGGEAVIKSVRYKLNLALIWHLPTTVVLVILNLHFRGIEQQLLINIANQALEQIVERWMLGTTVWTYLRDLSKNSPWMFLCFLASSIVYGGVHLNQDISGLHNGSLRPEVIAAPKGKFALQYSYQNNKYYEYVQGKPVEADKALLQSISSSVDCNFYNAEIIRKDVIGENDGQKLYLYTIKTQSGKEVRLLSTFTRVDAELDELSRNGVFVYQVGNMDLAYKCDVDANDIGTKILIPFTEQQTIFDFSKGIITREIMKRQQAKEKEQNPQ